MKPDAILWEKAFATSPAPYGLGLSEYRFWTMTPREMQPIREIWANYQATFHNAHFAAKDGLPFAAEDFLDPNSRKERQAQVARDKAEAAMETSKLSMMRPDSDDVPRWAKEVVRVN